jgi:hypothetical protein
MSGLLFYAPEFDILCVIHDHGFANADEDEVLCDKLCDVAYLENIPACHVTDFVLIGEV